MSGDSTSILKPLVKQAASLDIGWKLHNNGSVSVKVHRQDTSTLFQAIVKNDKELLCKTIDQDPDYNNYIAQGELRSQIVKNIFENEEKIAKNGRYKSLIEKAAKVLPWEKKDNNYFVSTDIKTPSEHINILNVLTFMEGNLINRPNEGIGTYRHESYSVGNSYQNHYVANEDLTKTIEQYILKTNKPIIDKQEQAYSTGEKMQRIIAERKTARSPTPSTTDNTTNNKEGAAVIRLNNRKTTYPIIFRDK